MTSGRLNATYGMTRPGSVSSRFSVRIISITGIAMATAGMNRSDRIVDAQLSRLRNGMRENA